MKNKKKDNKFGGNYLYTNTVRPNKDYGVFVGRDGEYGVHKFVKISFDEKEIKHSEGSRAVVCILSCRLMLNIPSYWRNDLTEWTEFEARGIAKCSKDDDFDLNKGIAIASAKAEIDAYRIAKRMCRTIKKQMTEMANSMSIPIQKFSSYTDKNLYFIDQVVEDKINLKPKE